MRLETLLEAEENLKKIYGWIMKNYNPSKVSVLLNDYDYDDEHSDQDDEQASDYVVDKIIDDVEKKLKIKLPIRDSAEVSDWIKEKFDLDR